MKVLVQWTEDDPQDWQEFDHSQWPTLPDDPVHGLNVQGVIFEGYDHYAVEDGPEDGVVVTVWNDPTTNDDPWQRWTILPLAPDPAFGGQLNTRQSVEWFGDASEMDAANNRLRKRGAFREPAGKHRHGVWVSDDLHEQHRAARSVRGWREW